MADVAGEEITGTLEQVQAEELPHPPFAPGAGDDAGFVENVAVGLSLRVGSCATVKATVGA